MGQAFFNFFFLKKMWTLLSNSRKKCLATWTTGFGFLLVLMIVQTVTGKLGEDAAMAWGWFFVNALPGLVLLLASLFGNRRPQKILPDGAHRALLAAAFCFTVATVVTLLVEPFAQFSGVGLGDWLRRSLLWLGPLNGLVLAAFWLVFLKKEAVFLPNEKIVLDFAVRKAADWAGSDRLSFQKKAIGFITKGELGAAFESLGEHFGQRLSSDIVLLQGQHATLVRDRDLGLVDPETAQRQLNRLTIGLIDLLETERF